MEQYLWVLKSTERDLIRELEPERLARLDEDGLMELHKRVRRARNKHSKNYRRGAASGVAEVGARGTAASKSDKSRARAYVFEEALSIVSGELARVAHDAAEALKDERLARARAGKSTGPESAGTQDGTVGACLLYTSFRQLRHSVASNSIHHTFDVASIRLYDETDVTRRS